jgi:hypothetical protein
MPPVTEEIKCPHDPGHGTVTKRWLPPEERELCTKYAGDVYEIDCPHCGKVEFRGDEC